MVKDFQGHFNKPKPYSLYHNIIIGWFSIYQISDSVFTKSVDLGLYPPLFTSPSGDSCILFLVRDTEFLVA